MKRYFTCSITILISVAVWLTGCKKNMETTRLTGSISGKYSPAKAAAGLIAFKAFGTDSIEGKLDSSNGFRITGLEPGKYKLAFTAMPGFVEPDTLSVAVNAGENSDIGTVVFKTFADSATGTYISGRISPASAATQILVRDKWGTKAYVGTPDLTGNFKIDIQGAGDYIVSFNAAEGFSVPANLEVKGTYRQNADLGTIILSPIVYRPKTIDTIMGPVFLAASDMLYDFIERAKVDSAIVISGQLYMSNQVVTPELASALNKIIAIKGGLMITRFTSAALTFKSLKEVGLLYVSSATALTSVDLSALKTVASGISLDSCPSLTNVKIDALEEFAGTLRLNKTGFNDLSDFRSVMYKHLNLDIENNQQLTSLLGLNFASDSIFDCTIRGNALLTSLNGLQGIKLFKNETIISNNPVLQTLTGLDNIIVAKHLTLTNNPQLTAVCGARQLINILKDAPPYQKPYQSVTTGHTAYITMQPLVASSNGRYNTRADLVAAIGQCP